MNFLPTILAHHTPMHTLIQFLTSPTVLIVGGVLVTLFVASKIFSGKKD